MEALLEPEVERGWIGDCRQRGDRLGQAAKPSTEYFSR